MHRHQESLSKNHTLLAQCKQLMSAMHILAELAIHRLINEDCEVYGRVVKALDPRSKGLCVVSLKFRINFSNSKNTSLGANLLPKCFSEMALDNL